MPKESYLRGEVRDKACRRSVLIVLAEVLVERRGKRLHFVEKVFLSSLVL